MRRVTSRALSRLLKYK